MMGNFRQAVITALFVLCLPHAALSADGLPTFELDAVYRDGGGLPADWSLGDISFTGYRPPMSTLTEQERILLTGTVAQGLNPLPYSTLIFLVVDDLYNRFGFIPERLSAELIRSVPQFRDASEEELQQFRSPVTGEWPRLNCSDFSRGNFFVKKLSESEVQHFAGKAENWADAWLGNYSDGRTSRLSSGVYYFRVYGETVILQETFLYRLSILN